MQYRFAFSILLTLGVVPATASDADQTTASIPSYHEAYESFQEEMAKGPPMPAEDKRIMEQAAKDLAESMPNPGLGVGDMAPDFSLPNAFGKQVRLGDLLSEGPVILVFYRGAWCPYCNLQLRGLHQTLPHIEKQGARLVAVTPQHPDHSRQQVVDDGYPFEILSDLDDEVMKSYRLFFEVPQDLSDLYKRRFSLDLAQYNGEDRYVLPVPATYIIDRDGSIKAAFVDLNYRQRPEPADILAAVQALHTRAENR